MTHRRTEQLGPAAEIWIKIGVNLVVALIAMIWLPWWLALVLGFCGFWAWFFASNIDWSEVDWAKWMDW